MFIAWQFFKKYFNLFVGILFYIIKLFWIHISIELHIVLGDRVDLKKQRNKVKIIGKIDNNFEICSKNSF